MRLRETLAGGWRQREAGFSKPQSKYADLNYFTGGRCVNFAEADCQQDKDPPQNVMLGVSASVLVCIACLAHLGGQVCSGAQIDFLSGGFELGYHIHVAHRRVELTK